MKYLDLATEALNAFHIGIERIVNKTLKSVWDKNAVGWHEQWDNVDFAGIYASCEGIVLLSRYGHTELTSKIINRVYELNLCRAFDNDYPIDKNSPYFFSQQRQRDKALNVAYKLSKFLLATKYIENDERDQRITADIVDRLLSLYDFDKSMFRNAVSSDNTSTLSTVTSFVALKDFVNANNPIILSTAATFNKTICLELTNSNIDSMMLTLWAISESIDVFDADVLNRATRLLKKILKYGYPLSNPIITVKFSIPMLGIRDSYSINKHLVFLSTVINFMRSGWLELEYTKFILSDVQDIISIFYANNAYGQNVEPFTVMFWENYNALLVLEGFHKLVNETLLKEEDYMIVNPKLFPNQELTIQDDLAVVIMPFKADWSDDIYDVFKEAVASYAGTTFSIWRSDEE